MQVKDLQNMISECIYYADEISSNTSIFPSDAKMPLRDLFRYDVIVFLGFLYEKGNPHAADQIEFIKQNLRMIITEAKFEELVDQKCNDPRFLQEAPSSIQYFVLADRDTDTTVNVTLSSKSKFYVDCFRKLGEGFIDYPEVKDETKQMLKDYINVLNATLNSAGIITSQHTGILKSGDRPAEKTATFTNQSDTDMTTVTSFDENTGQFSVKKTVSISGRNIMKKRADDVSEFMNFQPEEDAEDKVFKRGKGRVGGNRRGNDESEEIEASLDSLIAELQSLIGLGSVKEDVIHLINIIKMSLSLLYRSFRHMGKQQPFRIMCQNMIPIRFQQHIVLICLNILIGFQISDKAISIIQNKRNTIHTVTGCIYDLTTDAHARQEISAFCTREDLGLGCIDRRVRNAIFSKKGIRKMDTVFLHVDQKQAHALLHQCTDQTHMIRMIMGSQDVVYVVDL